MQKKHILFAAFVCVFAVACYFGGQALSDYVYNAGRAPESQSEAEPAARTPAPSQAPSGSQSGAYGTYDADGKPLWKGADGEKSPDGKWSVKGTGEWGRYHPEYDWSDKDYRLTGNKVGSM